MSEPLLPSGGFGGVADFVTVIALQNASVLHNKPCESAIHHEALKIKIRIVVAVGVRGSFRSYPLNYSSLLRAALAIAHTVRVLLDQDLLCLAARS